MIWARPTPAEALSSKLRRMIAGSQLLAATALLSSASAYDVVGALGRLGFRDRAVAYRLLSKDLALEVFDGLDARLQRDVVRGLGDDEVAAVFARLHPDDRVGLLEELPATVARRLLDDLTDAERGLTAEMLSYPKGTIGRRMSPRFVTTTADASVAEALAAVDRHLSDAETVYTIPVVDQERRLVGVVGLRHLLASAPDARVGEVSVHARSVEAVTSAETAARRCADLKLLALPVVDGGSRLVGLLTVDDALRILEEAESEDQARIAGSDPLRQPYLSTPVRAIVRSRVVWLLMLAVGAALTVRVLETFEATLEEVVVLSLFIPLLIGTGGNTGNQSATTVTRALALDDVHPRDIVAVMARELRVGLSLGLLLGGLGLLVASAFYGTGIGVVIGLSLLVICTMAAVVGSAMPMIGRSIRLDPAVFSNPFITTFIDATGLVVYFLLARAVLNL